MMFSLSTEPPFDGVLAVSEMLASKQWDNGMMALMVIRQGCLKKRNHKIQI